MRRRYGDRVEFLAVYVREAHPTDGWRMPSNDRAGIAFAQPRERTERVEAAQKCCGSLEITAPLLVDEMDDRVGKAYSGMPDRLYLIDREGKVAYKGGRGPFGFKPGEMEQSLVMLLLEDATAKPAHRRFAVPCSEEVWQQLPPAEKGAGQPLPAWARVFARTLPRTTAAMLELDYLHRTRSPLDPKLRAKMRWVAAHANRCAYSEAYAVADMRLAGVTEAEIRSLASALTTGLTQEREALAFADKLTRAADTLTDAEMARLMDRYGEKQVVAMVLLLAYANFQDRLILALDLPLEDGGPLKPLEIRFAKENQPNVPAKVPPRNTPKGEPKPEARAPIREPEWPDLDYQELQQAMKKQQARQPRIRVPSWDTVRAQLPPSYPAKKPLRIKWSLVCLGYQPELAAAWSTCLRTFAQEAQQDRVFEESLFWVITGTLHCFY